MVNVGGRSRGCLTCRKRRVKCDENHPSCRQCQRLGLQCGGPKGMAFIFETPSGSGTVQRRSTSKFKLSDNFTPAPLSASLSIAGFDLYICYTRSHLLRDGLIVSAITDTKAVDLMPVGTTVASRQVSHQAIMSLATILFGVQNRRPDIAQQGYTMHGVALKQLNEVLSDATRHAHGEVIVAVSALAISEWLAPTGPSNYLAHMMGLERFVDLQDPVSFWSANSSGFCKGVRFMILLASLKLGKPSILARPDWKKAMRTNASDEDLEEQDLFDVLADCSVLLAERDAMLSAKNAHPTKAKEQRDEIERRACCLLQSLHRWRERWDQNIKNSFATPQNPFGLEESHFPYPQGPEETLITVAAIPSLSAAMMLMLYNLALVYVLRITASLSLEESESSTGKIYHVDERTAARETCRCVQYYLSIRRRLDASAPPIVHWAIATAWTRLRRDDSAEGAWMRDLLSKRVRQVVAEGLWTTYKWINSLPEE